MARLTIFILAAFTFTMNAVGTTLGQTSGAACSAVLEAGVYNRISTSSSTTDYSNIQRALCESYSDYTYNQYKLDRAAFDNSQGVNANTAASAYCNSRAFNIDVAASASFFQIGGGSAGFKRASSSSECANNLKSTYDAYALMSASSFNLAQTRISSYQKSSCGSSNDLKFNSDSVLVISQIIEPQVYQAYISCLKLYASGIRFAQTSGVNQRSLAIDLVYVPAESNVPANLNGFNQTGPASCTLQGPGLLPGASTSFRTKLNPNTYYSIFCSLPSSTPADGGVTDIFFFTSPGGTFRALLFHSPPVNQLNALTASVKALSDQVAKLETLSNLATRVQTLSDQVTKLQTLSNLTTRVQTLSNQVTKLQALSSVVTKVQNATNQVTTKSEALSNQLATLQSTVEKFYRKNPLDESLSLISVNNIFVDRLVVMKEIVIGTWQIKSCTQRSKGGLCFIDPVFGETIYLMEKNSGKQYNLDSVPGVLVL